LRGYVFAFSVLLLAIYFDNLFGVTLLLTSYCSSTVLLRFLFGVLPLLSMYFHNLLKFIKMNLHGIAYCSSDILRDTRRPIAPDRTTLVILVRLPFSWCLLVC
jgi:hypothetical protein